MTVLSDSSQDSPALFVLFGIDLLALPEGFSFVARPFTVCAYGMCLPACCQVFLFLIFAVCQRSILFALGGVCLGAQASVRSGNLGCFPKASAKVRPFSDSASTWGKKNAKKI